MPSGKSLEARMRLSERWRHRYRTDHEFRLRCVNRQRIRMGLEPAISMPPVGEALVEHGKRSMASRVRDEKGRLLGGTAQ